MGMDISSIENEAYFRANVWSWRPIHKWVLDVIQKEHLVFKEDARLQSWGYNDGAGLVTKEDCILLATALEKNLPSEEVVYMNTDWGMRVDKESGAFISPEDKDYEKGVSPYSVSKEHLLEFIQFLRDCGSGFSID
jgi:hypothetical protein